MKPGCYLAAALLLAPLAGGGCSPGLFSSSEDDYARRISLERLRQIGQADLDRYKRAAPAEPAPGNKPDAPAMRPAPRLDDREKVELTLEQCRASALEHNLDLRVALVDPAIAQQAVSREEARFESAFTLRTLWQEQDSPTASSLVSAQSKARQIEPGVRIPTRTGGNVTVSLPVARSENNNSFSTLNPAYTSDLQFSLSHELLRGAGRRANTAALRIAGYNEQASEARTKLETIRQLAAVDRSYWRLFQARRQLDVRQQQYELASEQLARAERRVRAGAAPEIEVVRAQAGVSDQLEAIIVAQNDVLLQTRELKRIINAPDLGVGTKTLIVPTTAPDPIEYEFDTGELQSQALGNRMEMLELELQLASDAANIDLARNQTLPLLTLDYTYRVNGLGASTQDTFHTLERNHYEDWSVGLSAEIPLGNEGARSDLRRAILQRLQRLSTRGARELSIRQEVLNACDDIGAGWQRILAARQSVILNTRTLQAEQRQFEVGGSTSTNVLDAAAKLAEAQSAEIRALADYQISQVDLAFATGTLLGADKVRWDPVADPAIERNLPYQQLLGRTPHEAELAPDEAPAGGAPAKANPAPDSH